jgi:hypothetical protein
MLARCIIRAGSGVKIATDWSGEYAPDKDRSARLAARDCKLNVVLADAGWRTGGAAVGSCDKDLDAVAKGDVVVDSGKHGNPHRESLAAELGEGRRVPGFLRSLDQMPSAESFAPRCGPAKIYVSLTN